MSNKLYDSGMGVRMISASVARQTLPAELDRVEAGEAVTITRHGRPVAVLVSPGAYRSPRTAGAWAQAERVATLLDRARDEPLAEPAIAPERAEALARAVRAGRSKR